jgi:hypothetical protein
LAIGGAWARYETPIPLASLLNYPNGRLAAATSLLLWSCPILCTLSATVLGLRLRRPKPRYSRLTRQPGFVACAVAAIGSAIGGVLTLAIGTVRGYDPREGSIMEAWQYLSFGIGWAVAGAWISLALGRVWRTEASWVDRTGRLIGVCWIVVPLAVLAGYLVPE